MEFLGPRHVCLTLGSTCHELRNLSQSNSLWKIFWGKRCLIDWDMVSVSRDGDDDIGVESDNPNATSPHSAAMVFRHAMNATNLIIAPIRSIEPDNKCNNDIDIDAMIPDDDGTISLYRAYIDQHISMKESNLRVKLPPLSDTQIDTMNQLELRHRTCTQTWPGQLSLLHDDVVGPAHNNRLVTCQKSAVVWCDHPNCNIARCGAQGCVRSYRFASRMREEEINIPRVHIIRHNSMGGRICRCCSNRNYDRLSFVQCSWCRVRFCSEHVYSRNNGYYYQRNNKHGRGQLLKQKRSHPWYNCDECDLSSCPDCISQVFLTSPPNMDGCGVVTAGKVCRRTVCPQCMWYVGRKKQGSNTTTVSMATGNVPGGDYSKMNRTEICTVRGMDLLLASKNTSVSVYNNLECWDEFDTCCSKCLRHVDFRWRELTQVQDSFHGFMP